MKHYTGIDMVEIARIEGAVARFGERFLRRIYTDAELAISNGKGRALAVRFAGKEAVMKLLGTGVRGVRWRDIEILAFPSGKPRVNLYGGAMAEADRLGLSDIAISLTHSDEYAVASAFSTSQT